MYFKIFEFVKFAGFKFISVFTRFARLATFIKLHVSRPNLPGVNSIFPFAVSKSFIFSRAKILRKRYFLCS